MTTIGKTAAEALEAACAVTPTSARAVIFEAADAIVAVLSAPYLEPSRKMARRSEFALRSLLAAPATDVAAKLAAAALISGRRLGE